MSKQKAITPHGEVEYETVDCDSCSNEVMEGDEITYVIGEVKSSKYWSHKNEYEVSFDKDGYNVGNICPHCAEARNIDVSSSSLPSGNVIGDILVGLRNAHKQYIETMITHLNGDGMMTPLGEADIMSGMFMAAGYLCALIVVGLFVFAAI